MLNQKDPITSVLRGLKSDNSRNYLDELGLTNLVPSLWLGYLREYRSRFRKTPKSREDVYTSLGLSKAEIQASEDQRNGIVKAVKEKVKFPPPVVFEKPINGSEFKEPPIHPKVGGGGIDIQFTTKNQDQDTYKHLFLIWVIGW